MKKEVGHYPKNKEIQSKLENNFNPNPNYEESIPTDKNLIF